MHARRADTWIEMQEWRQCEESDEAMMHLRIRARNNHRHVNVAVAVQSVSNVSNAFVAKMNSSDYT